MREIKFRMWDGIREMMNNLEGRLVSRGIDDEYVLMQYTGLHDRKGVEIYEGDIIKAKAFWDEVVFEEGMFGFREIETNSMMKIDVFETEVIGNIYEKEVI